jgi:lysophospholipase L1-like esterase
MNPAPAKPLPTVFVIGDSISVHYGPFLRDALAGVFRYERKGGETAALNNLDVPEGANGGDSRMVRAYLEERLSDGTFQPDVLLFNAGLHDIKRSTHGKSIQIGLEDYRTNLLAIVDGLLRRGIEPVWVRTTPFRDAIHNGAKCPGFLRFQDDLEAYNRAADEIMGGHGVKSIDLHGFTNSLSDDPAGLFADHVHFHPEIMARQGAFIAGWLACWLKLSGR